MIDSTNFIGRLEEFLAFAWQGVKAALLCKPGESRLQAFIQGATLHRFHIPRKCGWSGGMVEKYLHHFGVSIFGRGFRGNNFYFAVRETQSYWAEYLLHRANVPIAYQSGHPGWSREKKRK